MQPNGVHWSLRIRSVTLAWLNVIGGASTIATTALMLQAVEGQSNLPAQPWLLANATILMLALRVEKPIPRTRVALGLPLGAAFCGLLSMLSGLHSGSGKDARPHWDADDVLHSITLSAFVLLVFGLPTWIARKRAAIGLVGEEKGEGLIAAIQTGYALLSGGLLYASVQLIQRSLWRSWLFEEKWERPFALCIGALAIACSGVALALSILRNRGRGAFMARIERGEHQQFRIDATAKGKVLIRVTAMGEGYRVADLTEELMTLENSPTDASAER
jgi:hypothetical protein